MTKRKDATEAPAEEATPEEVAPADAEETTSETAGEAPAKQLDLGPTTLVTYHGPADVAEAGGYRFRPGQPVAVPSDEVEGLLTAFSRSERFTIVKE